MQKLLRQRRIRFNQNVKRSRLVACYDFGLGVALQGMI
jgi:hypothetical protein